MPLEPGTTLGPYSVTAKIRRRRHGRRVSSERYETRPDVALKVLPQAFTDDPDRLARCEREPKS